MADSEKHINHAIKLSQQNVELVVFQLGVGLQYEYAPEGIRFSADYPGMGAELWASMQFELQKLFCDNGEPKSWVKEASGGDKRDLVVGLLTAVVTAFDVTMGIAVPAVALIIKSKVGPFCADKLSKPKRTVKQILSEKKERWQ